MSMMKTDKVYLFIVEMFLLICHTQKNTIYVNVTPALRSTTLASNQDSGSPWYAVRQQTNWASSNLKAFLCPFRLCSIVHLPKIIVYRGSHIPV